MIICRSFIGQAPMFLLALILCWISVPNTKSKHRGPQSGVNVSVFSKLGQADFLGSILFATFLIFVLLPVEFGGTRIAWTDPQIPIYFGIAALSLGLFIVAEKRRTRNQLLPLSMFRSRHTVSAFTIMVLQCGAQLGVRPGPNP